MTSWDGGPPATVSDYAIYGPGESSVSAVLLHALSWNCTGRRGGERAHLQLQIRQCLPHRNTCVPRPSFVPRYACGKRQRGGAAACQRRAAQRTLRTSRRLPTQSEVHWRGCKRAAYKRVGNDMGDGERRGSSVRTCPRQTADGICPLAVVVASPPLPSLRSSTAQMGPHKINFVVLCAGRNDRSHTRPRWCLLRRDAAA